MSAKQIPVYLFTGFLEAGKTRFIQETLEDPRFNNGERTLLLLCEEGEEEYRPESFCSKAVFLEVIENEEDFTAERLNRLFRTHRCERVLVEYNGMWSLDTLFRRMPEEWVVAQEFLFADANPFPAYNLNMRQLCYDKLKSCEIVIFNRCGADCDRDELHKIVRAVSRRCDIAYEAPDGSVCYDETVDPLPFDTDAPVIDISDRDYALFYRDLSEDMQKYNGKTVRYKALVAKAPKLPEDCFVFGRELMTCCVNDIQFAGVICLWSEAKTLQKGQWVAVTATIAIQKHKGYGGVGPVLTVRAVESAACPEEPIATFY